MQLVMPFDQSEGHPALLSSLLDLLSFLVDLLACFVSGYVIGVTGQVVLHIEEFEVVCKADIELCDIFTLH